MRFVLANYGTRGDVEPFVAVGQELVRRGHDVRMAVPNDSLGFVESAGLTAVAYGLDSRAVEVLRGDGFMLDALLGLTAIRIHGAARSLRRAPLRGGA